MFLSQESASQNRKPSRKWMALLSHYGTLSIYDCKAAAWNYLKLDKYEDLVLNKQSIARWLDL